jgi:hypothetical protein
MNSTPAINEPSIFISHVFPNKAEMVYETFAELFGANHIEDVDVVNHEHNGQDICRVYVHFKKWPTTPEFERLRNRLLNGETVQIVYDEPWYWKCVASKLPRVTSKGSMTAPPKKRIVLDDKISTSTRVKSNSLDVDKPIPVSHAHRVKSNSADICGGVAVVENTHKNDNIVTETWADKVKQPIEKNEVAEMVAVVETSKINTTTDTIVATTKRAVLDQTTMSSVHYEYCCYKQRLNLKTKEQFLEYMGSVIFPIIEKISPLFCAKITGMILEMDIDSMISSLEDKSLFDTIIVRCYMALQEAIMTEMTALMNQ